MVIQLFGHPFSSYTWKAQIAFYENDIPFEFRIVDPEHTENSAELARRSVDPDNVEARAARHYWGNLFDRFIRDDETDRRNMLLNYGYAVMRAGVARALVAYGFLPALGLFHASVLTRL